jgi:hypothetical protein
VAVPEAEGWAWESREKAEEERERERGEREREREREIEDLMMLRSLSMQTDCSIMPMSLQTFTEVVVLVKELCSHLDT